MRFFTGIGYFFKGGAFLLSHPRLWIYAILPWLISLLTLGGIAWLAFWSYGEYVGPWLVQCGDYLATLAKNSGPFMKTVFQALAWLITVLGRIMVTLVYIVFGVLWTFIVAKILSDPFNDLLAAKVEEIATGRVVEVQLSIIGTIWRMIINGIRTIIDYLIICVILLLLNLLPLIGQIIAMIFAWYFLATPYIDYTLERRGLSYDDKKQLLRQNAFMIIGFGMTCFIVLLIPLVNLFIIPISVVTGTLLAIEKIEGI